ncbi:uncharacterized protein AKAME5_002578200 [Lates japonicus]|uniref:Uncharacterized protein n=1 Tax=Lates japonicus TaxID=270547 RepID=A0AAD3NL59_LATJO|nr:uncharacterized protein AKAME5_001363000 [Lates japonicus]GLD74453.1 uncharacterized protein AKAME5_002578200 [Lates japonicus]
MDEEKDLRDLAERMGQLCVQERKDEVNRKGENKRREENTNQEMRKKDRKASTEGEAEENLRKPVMETGPVQGTDANRCTRSSQSDPAAMKEQRQLTVRHPSPLTVSTADCQGCKGSTGKPQEGEDTERAETGRGEEEQLAQSFVIL